MDRIRIPARFREGLERRFPAVEAVPGGGADVDEPCPLCAEFRGAGCRECPLDDAGCMRIVAAYFGVSVSAAPRVLTVHDAKAYMDGRERLAADVEWTSGEGGPERGTREACHAGA